MLKYLITDPLYYTNEIEKFEKRLEEKLLKSNIDLICFRDKSSKNYKELAKVFIKICKKHNIKNILLNEKIELAKELNTGIHLTSYQFDKISDAKKHNLYTIISCHTKEEIRRALQEGANAITYSPIFETPNKGVPKGVSELKSICEEFDIDIFALGGIIDENQIGLIKNTKAKGFASIRYFL